MCPESGKMRWEGEKRTWQGRKWMRVTARCCSVRRRCHLGCWAVGPTTPRPKSQEFKCTGRVLDVLGGYLRSDLWETRTIAASAKLGGNTAATPNVKRRLLRFLVS